jgi:hypothetical protein
MLKFVFDIFNAVKTNHRIMNPVVIDDKASADVLWTEDDLAFLERLASFDPDEIGKSTSEERTVS